MSYWISVSEKLPAYGRAVLVSRDGRSVSLAYRYMTNKDGEHWRYWGYGEHSDDALGITHWMGLPDPCPLPPVTA